jgi:hypothetical protein
MPKKVFPIRLPTFDDAPTGPAPRAANVGDAYSPSFGFADGGQGKPLFTVNTAADRRRASELGAILRTAVDKVLDIAIAQDGLEPDVAYLLQHAIRASNAAMDFAVSE